MLFIKFKRQDYVVIIQVKKNRGRSKKDAKQLM